MNSQISDSWKEIIKPELQKEYFKKIKNFLQSEIEHGKIIYPAPQKIFSAFDTTSLTNLKVVILGQDPYHGAGQAHGLSFSVQDDIKVPPSLQNIYKELKNEYPDYTIPSSGNLEGWAKQGVLLLNSILTVEAQKPASHGKIGWTRFTETIIEKISQTQSGVIFILWGNFAKGKKILIDENKHYILESPHPSPFSAHTGFLGNGHFKRINEILESQGKERIIW